MIFAQTPKHFTIPFDFTFIIINKRSDISAPLVFTLEFLRRAWGAPIRVTSGVRCPQHNKAVGGAAQSRHMAGLAADIQPIDMKLMPPFQSLARSMFGGLDGFELILKQDYVHIAVPRGEWNVWDGNRVRFSI